MECIITEIFTKSDDVIKIKLCPNQSQSGEITNLSRLSVLFCIQWYVTCL